ncbi:MAG: G8 domain-containing protein, partial [Bacteroidota bacterium]
MEKRLRLDSGSLGQFSSGHLSKLYLFLLLAGFMFSANESLYSQNAILGNGFANGWETGNESDWEFFDQGAGSSRILIRQANGTEDQYFRLIRGWGSGSYRFTQFQPSSGSDTQINNFGTTINPLTGGSDAFFINVSNINHNYIFKTPEGGGDDASAKFVVFEVQGDIRNVTNVSQSIEYVRPGDEVIVTATVNDVFNTGQSVYLRYTTDNFASSQVLEMSGSGTIFSATIPSTANTLDSEVIYYVFTSGSGLTISHADADFFTINLNDNSGNNYRYTPRQINYANLQFPEQGEIPGTAQFDVFARVFIAQGVTGTGSAVPGLSAWIGYRDQNATTVADFDSGWTWVEASFSDNFGNDSEFRADIGSVISTPGTYYYVSRFQYGNGPFVYGGYPAGFWDGTSHISGILRFGKYSVASGNWSDNATWDGDAPVTSQHVYIRSGDSVVLNTNAQVNSLTIESGGTLIVPGAQVLTIGPDGSFVNNGVFDAGEGTVIIRGTSSTGGTTATEFNNITVDGINVSLDFAATKVNGILELKGGNVLDAPELLENSTLRYAQGGNYQRVTEWNNPWNVQVSNNTSLDLNIGDFAGDLVVQGNLIIDENSSVAVDSGHDDDFIVNGDVFLHGTLALSPDIGSDMQVGGNWTRSGTFTPNNRLVTFNGVSTQTLSGQTTFNYLTVASGAELVLNDGITMALGGETEASFLVANGGTLDVNTQIVDGAGSFTLEDGATLKIGSPDGIVAAPEAKGNIQTTTRNFSDTGIYHYTGSGSQFSGNALPLAHAPKVVIVELQNDADELSINTSGPVDITAGGRLEIRAGTLVETEQNISNASKAFSGDGDLIMSGGNYLISSIASTEHKPRLTGNYTMTNGNVILAANGDQLLRGGKDYHNLIFRGSTNTSVSNATPSISGTVQIESDAVVNAQNFEFGSSSTNLTMTGGRFIVSASRASPDMGGDYNLMGGTVEFAGSGANHRIKGGIDYFNIDITGDVKNPNENVVIRENGLFTIRNGGAFTITNVALTGAGGFAMENGSTLIYGSPNGITVASEGTDTNKGNIRTSNRTFNPQA